LRALKAGQFADQPIRTDRDTWHIVTEIDAAAGLGDCQVCGPRVPIRINKTRGRIWCREKLRIERRFHRLKFNYGLTAQQYEAMTITQGGRCLICADEPDQLVVDHCHATGRVRGLLCSSCNTALGFMRDSPLIALAASSYLSEHS
jgi:hypothetical protein